MERHVFDRICGNCLTSTLSLQALESNGAIFGTRLFDSNGKYIKVCVRVPYTHRVIKTATGIITMIDIKEVVDCVEFKD